MSAFNHMGKLVSVDGEWATYEYYPDYISHESKFGMFKVKLDSLLVEGTVEYEVVSQAEPMNLWFNRPNEHVVLALVSKIKKIVMVGNPLPETVYHIA